MVMQRLVFVILVVCGVFIAGMQHFAHMMRTDSISAQPLMAAAPQNTGIAVLTGSGGRIKAGLSLLLADHAERMLISGIGEGVSKDDIVRIASDDGQFASHQLARLMDCCIDLGPLAHNTRGNATETLRWADQNNLDAIILVTADFHLPRALVEFRRAMPERVLIPHAVPTKGLGIDAKGITEWWQSGRRLLTIAREFGKYLASRMV